MHIADIQQANDGSTASLRLSTHCNTPIVNASHNQCFLRQLFESESDKLVFPESACQRCLHTVFVYNSTCKRVSRSTMPQSLKSYRGMNDSGPPGRLHLLSTGFPHATPKSDTFVLLCNNWKKWAYDLHENQDSRVTMITIPVRVLFNFEANDFRSHTIHTPCLRI